MTKNPIAFAWYYAKWALGWITRKPFVWVDPHPWPEADIEEPWNKQTWHAVRPRFSGLLSKRPCGCTSRFGRIIYYNMSCSKHGLNLFDD